MRKRLRKLSILADAAVLLGFGLVFGLGVGLPTVPALGHPPGTGAVSDSPAGTLLGPAGGTVVLLTDRARALVNAVAAYTQDHDETLPPMHTPQEFEAAVVPYARSARIFRAPNGKPFVPNAALSGVSLTAITDRDTTVLFQDAPPYPDGLATVAFVDGHLERGGVEYGDPNVIVVSRAKQVALAVEAYVQDNSETFPPMQTVPEFQAALAPYLSSRRVLFNTNGQAFVPNAALSGTGLADLTDPAATVLFQDTAPYTGGTPTTAYADGHVTHSVAPHRRPR